MPHNLRSLAESELEEIDGRLERCTPGPWTSTVPGYVDAGVSTTSIIAMTYAHCAAGELPLPSTENAEFIAHARTDVPRLIAEVRRLRGELERLRKLIDADQLTAISPSHIY